MFDLIFLNVAIVVFFDIYLFSQCLVLGTQIQCVATLRYLTSGARSVRGSICFVDRSTEMLELLEVLPRLPKEMDFIELWKGRLTKQPRKFKVRVHVVKKALIWLKTNHPAYRNIEISEAKLQELEEGLVGVDHDQICLPRVAVPKNVDLWDNKGNMGHQSAPTAHTNLWDNNGHRSDLAGSNKSGKNKNDLAVHCKYPSLHNFGRTCYLNSLFQALTYIPAFNNMVSKDTFQPVENSCFDSFKQFMHCFNVLRNLHNDETEQERARCLQALHQTLEKCKDQVISDFGLAATLEHDPVELFQRMIDEYQTQKIKQLTGIDNDMAHNELCAMCKHNHK